MSLRRNSSGGTPGASRVRQAFKSPFRVAGSTDPNANNTSTNKKDSEEISSVNKETNIFTIGCSDRVVADRMNQTPPQLQSKVIISNSLTPKRITIGRSPSLLSSCRRRVVPRHFSVPFRTPSKNTLSQNLLPPENQLAQLCEKESELDEEIASLKNCGYKIEELQSHIENLHQYNEIKDAAQLVMGRLAELEGVTTKEIHERYGVPTME